jgi:hypothetical protein
MSALPGRQALTKGCCSASFFRRRAEFPLTPLAADEVIE